MKKLLCAILVVCMFATLTACTKAPQEDPVVETGFVPALDTATECKITIAGSYDNFEALEAEFDRFNEYYPNVQLSYVKLDDYNNMLGTVLESKDKPNIFFSYTWMIDNEQYDSVVANMEDLSDPALKLNLDCIRPGLVNKDADGRIMLVPVFSRTYGMLVNDDLFEKEGISVPTTLKELKAACKAFSDKGYASPMMGYSLDSSSSIMNTIAYPLFAATLADNPKAVELAAKMDPAAGKYTRSALEVVDDLMKNGCINLEECNKIEDNYNQVILRFFEGDVPMMVCAGDAVSGTKKRESQSEAFTKSPFNYSFAPIPVTDEGGYFIDSPSIEFSVNKNCDNLDMTNEFMRFLINKDELNAMSSIKRLLTPTTNLSLDSIFAPFSKVPADRIISPEVISITDPMTIQLRIAAFNVGTGALTIDEAVEKYGSFE